MTDQAALPFALHPMRQALYDELHTRPFHVVGTPQQISHLAFLAQQSDLNVSYQLLCDLCRRYNVNQPGEKTVSFQQDFGEFTVRWERHMEFYSVTILRPGAEGGHPFTRNALEIVPENWLESLPGQAVAAFHMVVSEDQESDPESLSRFFEGQRLMISEAKHERARLHTAFRLHGDGFGRFLVQNRSMTDSQMGRLTRRLIEVETYRLMAQLALPMAKRIAPDLEKMDKELAQILSKIPQIYHSSEERQLLHQLSVIAARLEGYRAETNHRFTATLAYHELVRHRLNAIGETKVDGYMSLDEFMTRRLNPAIRTCESVQGWMEDLSRRIERAGDLLRTRVNLTLQEQNQNLLASMDRRGRLQFRLQETVEGLSVAAISYYMVGLLSYLLSGLPLDVWGLDKKVLLAFGVPVILLLVWRLTHRIKHRLIKLGPDD